MFQHFTSDEKKPMEIIKFVTYRQIVRELGNSIRAHTRYRHTRSDVIRDSFLLQHGPVESIIVLMVQCSE